MADQTQGTMASKHANTDYVLLHYQKFTMDTFLFKDGTERSEC
jgi:hypothetical protein